MSELSQLYQQVILDHGRNPRGARHPDAPAAPAAADAWLAAQRA